MSKMSITVINRAGTDVAIGLEVLVHSADTAVPKGTLQCLVPAVERVWDEWLTGWKIESVCKV